MSTPEQATSQIVDVITPRCPVCGEDSVVRLTMSQYQALTTQGNYIQDIFPGWNPDKRELLISGTHPHCWNKIFTEQDEEDEDHWDWHDG